MLSAPPQSPAPLGVSGRLAALFVGSKLTPLIIIASLLLGLFAIVLTPREEEPQIVVPMADVWLSFPGASAKVVEEQLTKPIERKLSEIKTVEYVYSISRPGGALIIVRFYVGEPMEQSLVDLYDKLMSSFGNWAIRFWKMRRRSPALPLVSWWAVAAASCVCRSIHRA